MIPLPLDKKGRPRRSQAKPITKKQRRVNDANALIEALVDAALAIGERGILNDLVNFDFYLPVRQVLDLMPASREDRERFSRLATNAPDGRLYVSWPDAEDFCGSELREQPLKFVGLLMSRVLDGDAAFFDEVANALREAKINAKRPASARTMNVACKVAAPLLRVAFMAGDPDWFTRLQRPLKQSMAPFAIWRHCSERHKLAEIPTRRDIRELLKAKGIPCRNLRATLKRMGLDWLAEGPRGQKA